MRRHNAVVAIILTIGLLLGISARSYSEVDLSPEAVKEAAQQGFARADREVEAHHLEKMKTNGRITEEGLDRFRIIEEMNQEYEKWKALSKKAGDLAERARRVRALQYKLEELTDSKDFSAPRKRAVWKDETRYLTKQPPELPELPPLPKSPE